MSARPLLPDDQLTDRARDAIADFHADVVGEVARAVSTHDVVVVGMGWNPFVKKARQALDEAGVPHHDLDYGNYTSMWKERLAIKLWSGWPTFPQVFVKGRLVGGDADIRAALAAGEVAEALQGEG